MTERTLQENRKKGIILIDENYCIMVMPIDYALAKIRIGKNGQQYYEPFAYYSCIGKCLKEYLHESVHCNLREKPGFSLPDALEAVQNSIQRCISIINEKFPDYDVVKIDSVNSGAEYGAAKRLAKCMSEKGGD